MSRFLNLILWFYALCAQDDFIGDYKYAAFNNITTINFKACSNYATVVSPSIVKSTNNPLFSQDKPWEPRIDNGYPNIIYDANASDKQKTFQLWYDDFISTSPHIEGTLYANSADGIRWNKPNLGIVEFNGSTNNNIMFQKSGGVGLWKDRYTTNQNELYKCFGDLPHGVAGTATSPNGIYNWTNFRKLNLNNRYDDHNNMFFDVNRSNDYIAVTRGIDFPPRTVAISQSKDSYFNSSFSDAVVVESGGDVNQTYSQITFKYYNIYLGLVMIFYSNDPNGRVFCELAFSTDLHTWYRIQPDEELIPLSPLNSGQFDSHVCFTGAYPIVYQGKVLLYYFGGNGPHSGQRNSSFGLATIRLDGFAGIKNKVSGKSAAIESYALTVNGKYFIVNVDVMSGGNIKIGFQNQNSFSVDNFDVVNRNVTNYVVSWKGNKDISSLLGQKVVIQFELMDSILYTFGFVNNSITLL